jgi:hypothetical protein
MPTRSRALDDEIREDELAGTFEYETYLDEDTEEEVMEDEMDEFMEEVLGEGWREHDEDWDMNDPSQEELMMLAEHVSALLDQDEVRGEDEDDLSPSSLMEFCHRAISVFGSAQRADAEVLCVLDRIQREREDREAY